MTIDKAIEILEEEIGRQVIYYGGKRDDAIKLGIEALKRIKGFRRVGLRPIDMLLPGETE